MTTRELELRDTIISIVRDKIKAELKNISEKKTAPIKICELISNLENEYYEMKSDISKQCNFSEEQVSNIIDDGFNFLWKNFTQTIHFEEDEFSKIYSKKLHYFYNSLSEPLFKRLKKDSISIQNRTERNLQSIYLTLISCYYNEYLNEISETSKSTGLSYSEIEIALRRFFSAMLYTFSKPNALDLEIFLLKYKKEK